MHHESTENVVVAVCTYKRLGGLSALLGALENHDLPQRTMVLVVDNDPEMSARMVADRHTGKGMTLKYVHAEPRGLVVARNVALDFARKHDSILIFIDDDEIPEPSWLPALVEANACRPDAIVAGPVHPKFESALPTWDSTGKFWSRPTYSNGEIINCTVPDSNILYPKSLIHSSLRYDMKYNTSGGQETHLLRRWASDGGQIVWSADAVVVEAIPEGRLTLEYAQERCYFGSLSYAWIERGERRLGWLSPLVRGLVRGLQGVFLRAIGTAMRHERMKALGAMKSSASRGLIQGLYIDEYDRYASYQFDVARGAAPRV